MRYVIMLIPLLFFMISPGVAASTSLMISVRSSPDARFQTTLRIEKNAMIETIANSERKQIGQPLPLSDVYLATGNQHFILGRKGHVYHVDSGKKLQLAHSIEEQLLRYADLLRDQHYGQLLPWKKVRHLVPKKATFTVVDLETGKTFGVQRRAGSAHADVQPLTREDTKTMKSIYDGHWSWRRRPILVNIDGRTIAASMHGMPHGAGAIRNGFPGHFCIHFFGSKTHRSEKMDPAHEIMIYQAAGNIHRFFEHATPYQLVDAFFVAANQNDNHLLKMTISREMPDKTQKLLDIFEEIEAINNVSPIKKESIFTPVGVEISVDVRFFRKGEGETKDTVTFIVTRNAPGERWHIDVGSLVESLKS